MIEYPFVILSDIHCNDWNQFSYIRADKVNSRLNETLEAIEFAAKRLKEEGGMDIIITGDLFHTRGKIKPSVFNPVFELFGELSEQGFNIWMLPGNHDLEGKNSDCIGNATFVFDYLRDCYVFNEVTEVGNFVFIPWIEHKDEFVSIINAIENPTDKVVFCHIGIDGVLDQVAGKVGKAVFERGFKYVFSGDYHNHKALGNGIYSVGALTHHSFSDIGSTAGFLLVTEDKVEQIETNAPKFVNGGNKLDCSGNIVRLTGEMSEEEAEKAVKAHYAYGAKHVQDLTTRPTLKDASTATVELRVDLSLDELLESYTKRTYGENYAAILQEAKRIKNEHV